MYCFCFSQILRFSLGLCCTAFYAVSASVASGLCQGQVCEITLLLTADGNFTY